MGGGSLPAPAGPATTSTAAEARTSTTPAMRRMHVHRPIQPRTSHQVAGPQYQSTARAPATVLKTSPKTTMMATHHISGLRLRSDETDGAGSPPAGVTRPLIVRSSPEP